MPRIDYAAGFGAAGFGAFDWAGYWLYCSLVVEATVCAASRLSGP